MAKNQTLSLRSQWLGERLRAARVRSGYNQQQAGEYLRLELSAISRFERGTQPIRPSYIRDLISFYGIDNARERDALLRLSEDSWRKDWWDGDTDGLETGFIDYTWLESRATQIREFSPMIVPGLLQTEDYIKAIMMHSPGDPTAEEVKRLVELRLTRQRILESAEPTSLSAVIGEAALRRAIGGPEVRIGQLRHLTALPPHIKVRILPDSAGWSPDCKGPFTHFEMPDPYPEVAYIESLVDRTFFEEPSRVSAFRAAYADVARIAYSPEKSRDYIRSLTEELT
ncbi:helix-turn-helix transcriptional regulator [Phytomonospora sp. NPDC050363]|uniref:helix-turn-helix domain-containing protein n=1 Tax=Phytomonospora sp. NPDC050363 TaxID=3155642 RepID=UPI0033F2CD1B